MYNEVIKLVSYTDTEDIDEYGDVITIRNERPVFAMVKSVGMKEFYQAQSLGLKPEIVFVLSDYLEYSEEKEVIYKDVVYKVLRTYMKSSNELEITCTGGVHIEHA